MRPEHPAPEPPKAFPVKTVKRIFLLFVAALLGGMFLLYGAMAATFPDTAKLGVKEGDIVFQTVLGTQGYAIIFASKSAYTHMGFIRMTKDGPVVVEAVGPVKETPLEAWINRGVYKRLAVMRLKAPKKDTFKKALGWAKKHYGKPYDIFFLPGDDEFYCSELVRGAFKEGAGIPLGKIEKVKDLTSSAAMDKVIEQRWPFYPPCRGKKGMTFEKCLGIIKEQELVTPASIARDPALESVYSNYPG